jgi:hypothetical protein
MFDEAGVLPAGWGLPVDWRGGEETYGKASRRCLASRRRRRRSAASRTSTWIPSASDDLPLDENRRFHVERFTPVARVLADTAAFSGWSSWAPRRCADGQRYPFLHTMGDMLAMAAEIGPERGPAAGLLALAHLGRHAGRVEYAASEQVVYVHVNDAPRRRAHRRADRQRARPARRDRGDRHRRLPARLDAIGYDGPVTPEPFKKELADLPDDETRLRTVGAAMDEIFRRAA